MKYYITTDTHFGHNMLVENKHRDYGYEEIILNNIEKIKGDVFIHLGDICIGNDLFWNKRFIEIVKKNFKKVILVRGNHDNKSYNWYYNLGWDFVCETMRLRFHGKEILFSHLPILIEDSKYTLYHKVDYNLHGHMHGKGNYSHRKVDGISGFNYDVAPDTHNMKPILLDDNLIK